MLDLLSQAAVLPPQQDMVLSWFLVEMHSIIRAVNRSLSSMVLHLECRDHHLQRKHSAMLVRQVDRSDCLHQERNMREEIANFR